MNFNIFSNFTTTTISLIILVIGVSVVSVSLIDRKIMKSLIISGITTVILFSAVLTNNAITDSAKDHVSLKDQRILAMKEMTEKDKADSKTIETNNGTDTQLAPESPVEVQPEPDMTEPDGRINQ